MALRIAQGDPDIVTTKFPAVADGTVTVTVTNAAGTTVQSGNATSAGGGLYTFQLSATTCATLASLKATFTGTFSTIVRTRREYVQVAGEHYVTIDQVRDTPLISVSVTDDQIKKVRSDVEDQVESNVGASFVARYVREVVPGNDTSVLRLAHNFTRQLISASVDGVPDTTASIESGALVTDGRWPYGSTVTVEYAEGYSDTPPSDVANAALQAIRSRLLTERRTGVPGQATALTTEVGTLQLAIAGMRHPFGIPEVDAVVVRWTNHLRVPL